MKEVIYTCDVCRRSKSKEPLDDITVDLVVFPPDNNNWGAMRNRFGIGHACKDCEKALWSAAKNAMNAQVATLRGAK